MLLSSYIQHKHFTMFLNKKKASKSIDYFSIVPERLEMEWQTVYNDVDCGVFVMHHMGTYFGGGTSSWDAKIKKESVCVVFFFYRIRYYAFTFY